MNYSNLRSSPRINLANSIPLRCPLTINLEPTNKCIFKCRYCSQSNESYEKSIGYHTMNIKDCEKICRQIREMGKVKTLNIPFNGEPLLHPQIISFVENAKSCSERVILTTNGALLDDNISSGLIGIGLDYLRISIYSIDEESHRKITGNRLVTPDMIYNNIRKFKNMRGRRTKPFLYVKMIRRGEAENNEFLRMYENLADEAALEDVTNLNGVKDSGRYTVLSDRTVETQASFKNKKKVCPSPFYTLIIHSDLKVTVCCVDWNKSNVVGDLSKQSLYDVWNGPKLFNLQFKMLERESVAGCRSCSYLHTFPDNIDALKPAEFLRKMVYEPQC